VFDLRVRHPAGASAFDLPDALLNGFQQTQLVDDLAERCFRRHLLNSSNRQFPVSHDIQYALRLRQSNVLFRSVWCHAV